MPGNLQPGRDQNFYDWSPIVSRPQLEWPEGAQIAFCLIVNLEHYEWAPPKDSFMPSYMPGGLGRGVFPDIRSYSHREYGNRVGVYRIMKILDRYGLRATAAADAKVAENYAFLMAECQKREWEFIGHGVTVNRMITSNMSEPQEREYIRRSIDALAKATGTRPLGWLGPESGESSRTLSLLEAEDIRYVCDWPTDEQPHPIGESRSLYSLPVMTELDDVSSSWTRSTSIMDWSHLVQEAFSVMHGEGGRVFVLNLHPWFIGQPFRSRYLDQILARIDKIPGVWKATGREIIDWCAGQTQATGVSAKPQTSPRTLT